MALQVVSMEELKLQVLYEPGRTGETVDEVCRRRGISRQTFYSPVRGVRDLCGTSASTSQPLSLPVDQGVKTQDEGHCPRA